MKAILTLCTIILSTTIYSQLIVDAGEDRHLCLKVLEWEVDSGNPILGGNDEVAGGIPPYTYIWEFRSVFVGTIYKTASDILDDTTIAHPKIKQFPFGNDLEMPYIKLTVVDSEGNIGVDSIKVTYSEFGVHLTEWQYSINEGDSIYLNKEPNIGGGIPPTSYTWEPAHGVLHQNEWSFWAKPDYSLEYQAVVIDSMGCKAEGGRFYTVNVNSVGIIEQKNVKQISLYPNPTEKNIKFDNFKELQNSDYIITNINGKQVQSGVLSKEELNVSKLAAGQYVLTLVKEDVAYRGVFIKE
jgi:hypothetical protein